MKRIFADIHCHPTLKSYGKSFPNKKNSNNLRSKSSIYNYDPPTLGDKLLNYAGGLIKFSQSNFTAQAYGNVGLICPALYPIERGFFDNSLGTGFFSDVLLNFITGVGKDRVNKVQSFSKNEDYYNDLKDELNFLKQLDGKIFKLEDKTNVKYVVSTSSADLQLALQDSKIFTIIVIPSFEGGHSFGCGINPVGKPCDPNFVLHNVDEVKNWANKPLYITLAHHFYNELCGHAKSLTDILDKAMDQSYMINTGFTPLGIQVAKKLLDNTDGKRIIIDIKHMSKKSRQEYFELLQQEYSNENIPIIASHAAVVGNSSDQHFFNQLDINFSDDEILRIGKSKGLFGVQLDERRIASMTELNKAKGNIEKRKILYNWARLVWRQIQHITEVLDENGQFAWGIQTLGTDFDGIIDPLGGYWTSEEFQFLDDYLLKHAFNYMNSEGKNLNLSSNRIDAEEIVNRFMGDNAIEFVFRNY